MDQYAVLFGKENSFIQLDCRTLHVEYAPSNFEGYELILVDSCVKHSLAESAYNKRREECEEGLNLIKKRFPNVQSLRDVTATILSEVKNDLSAIVYTRVRYIVEENQRHADTCEALRLGDVKKIGALLYQTHLGLKNDYEVSCAELDFLVDTAMNITGVAGSRLMGGGFGGCSINLIKKEEAENFKLLISKKYQEKFNITPAIIEVQISNGISII
jgi:galactokinase